ncbi:arginine/serine-rich protein 1-like [Diorhabda carinulata]|uniref:arginine/serine-rich protein 1-like n=1 Tax=Diorhabda carinulata TaxID=1163345 RepID=UPI0025A2FF09|nr:arginine/serine-rich protein 1-like [Diorhabda carinulata]
MEVDKQKTASAAIPKELEGVIQSKVAEIVTSILENTKLGRRKRRHSRSESSRSRSRSKSRSRSRGGRSRSRSKSRSRHGYYKHGSKKSRRSCSRERCDVSCSRDNEPCVGWENFGPFPPRHHHHFHHHPPHHHGWFRGEFGPWARKGKWGRPGRFPWNSNCKCGNGTEAKESEKTKDDTKEKEGTPAAERYMTSDLEYLDLCDDADDIE